MAATGATKGLATIVGENLQTARTEAGMTQHGLAVAHGGVDAMAISRWERGVNRPADANLLRLGEVLGRQMVWFLTEHSEAEAA
jgi:transcriptional regulator with XRE-family HTH domain